MENKREISLILDDVAKAITILLQKQNTNGIFNISRGKEINILDLAILVKKIAKSDSLIELIDFPTQRLNFKVNRRVGCANKLWQELETKPEINLENGLENYFSILKSAKIEALK